MIALLNLMAIVASQTALARHFNFQESNSAEFYHELGLEHFSVQKRLFTNRKLQLIENL